jgi:hypothetical protein
MGYCCQVLALTEVVMDGNVAVLVTTLVRALTNQQTKVSSYLVIFSVFILLMAGSNF